MPKVRVTIRLEEEDFLYIKSLFHVQGYNRGVRAVIRRFVRLCRIKEQENAAAGKPTTSDLPLPTADDHAE